MAPKGPKRKPRFFWQGMLILLPVVLMAGIALAALVQDRAAAEREAKGRAEELLAQVNHGFDRAFGFQLDLVAAGPNGFYWGLWSKAHLTAAGLWPGSARRREMEHEREVLSAGYAEAESVLGQLAQSSGCRPEDMAVLGLVFTTNGAVFRPPEAAREIHPPGWRLEMTPEQSAALEALEQLDASTADAEVARAARQRWWDTHPPGAALDEAEFLDLRLTLAQAPAAEAVRQWLAFAQTCAGTKPAPLSESGLPLSDLALAKALQRARESGPTEALWTALAGEVELRPSAFTPMLLELAEPLTTSRPELRTCLQALRWRWKATERAWDLADAIRQRTRIQGAAPTNCWLDFQGARWLCLLQPADIWTGTNRVASQFIPSRLCPKTAVVWALRKAVQDSHLSLPAYLSLSAELEGEPITLAPAPRHNAPAPAETLALAEGRLSCRAILHVSAGTEAEIPFESMPGRPRYTLRIELADRAQLLAAHQRRIWLFGALVLAAALTAAVGFAAAYRSFQRQLRLGEMKSNFVSSVSHELRAPIASVRLLAESLERGKVSEPNKQREYFRFIGQECRRLSSLIENVLDFSRIEQDRKQYEFEPTDLLELVRHTVGLMEPYAAERGVSLRLQLPDSLPLSPAPQPSLDGKAIQQALVNLVDNALKHSPKGEQVIVGLEFPRPTLHAPRLTLWVQDHGPGIPLGEQEKIFERFYRLGSELRRETQGVGIGLSIVKHVVEAHGGQVRVRSTVGQGSRFTMELPMHSQ